MLYSEVVFFSTKIISQKSRNHEVSWNSSHLPFHQRCWKKFLEFRGSFGPAVCCFPKRCLLPSSMRQGWWGVDTINGVYFVHPGKLTCPLKRDYFNRKYIFQPSIFRGHVSFRECTPCVFGEESRAYISCRFPPLPWPEKKLVMVKVIAHEKCFFPSSESIIYSRFIDELIIIINTTVLLFYHQ